MVIFLGGNVSGDGLTSFGFVTTGLRATQLAGLLAKLWVRQAADKSRLQVF